MHPIIWHNKQVPQQKEETTMHFRRIRDLREDADLTQTQIAEHLGIAQTVYSRYERGYQTIPLHLLIRLADFYNVSLDYLTGRCDQANPSPATEKTQKR